MKTAKQIKQDCELLITFFPDSVQRVINQIRNADERLLKIKKDIAIEQIDELIETLNKLKGDIKNI